MPCCCVLFALYDSAQCLPFPDLREYSTSPCLRGENASHLLHATLPTACSTSYLLDVLLLINPDDAARLNLGSGSRATITTQKGQANVLVEVSDRMMRGLVSLPNGLGLDYPDEDGNLELTGVAPNELTSIEHRDKFAGTPWHKSVPVRIEAG